MVFCGANLCQCLQRALLRPPSMRVVKNNTPAVEFPRVQPPLPSVEFVIPPLVNNFPILLYLIICTRLGASGLDDSKIQPGSLQTRHPLQCLGPSLDQWLHRCLVRDSARQFVLTRYAASRLISILFLGPPSRFGCDTEFLIGKVIHREKIVSVIHRIARACAVVWLVFWHEIPPT